MASIPLDRPQGIGYLLNERKALRIRRYRSYIQAIDYAVQNKNSYLNCGNCGHTRADFATNRNPTNRNGRGCAEIAIGCCCFGQRFVQSSRATRLAPTNPVSFDTVHKEMSDLTAATVQIRCALIALWLHGSYDLLNQQLPMKWH